MPASIVSDWDLRFTSRYRQRWVPSCK